jgi:preprotein translocase subunit Sec61beta
VNLGETCHFADEIEMQDRQVPGTHGETLSQCKWRLPSNSGRYKAHIKKLRNMAETHWGVLHEYGMTVQSPEIRDRDKLNPCAPKANELECLELRAWGINLENRVLNQSTGSQGKLLELFASVDEAGNIRFFESEALEGKTCEPTEGDVVGTGERHELISKLG